jgi:hypothetical protein
MRPCARRTIRYLTVILVALAASTGSTAAANGSSEARLIVGLHGGASSSSVGHLFSSVAVRHEQRRRERRLLPWLQDHADPGRDRLGGVSQRHRGGNHMGRRPRRTGREHELGRLELVVDTRQRRLLRARRRRGSDCCGRKLELQLRHVSLGHAWCDRRCRYDQRRHEVE